MAIELDHLFVAAQVKAPEMQSLLDLGLIEGRSNIHPGQGTANRCIFWQNFMLELLFVVDESEVSNSVIKPTQLKERCNYRQTGYSPFGIAFRRQEKNASLPFITWDYKPPYLPEHLQIDIAKDTQPNEPLLFVVPFMRKNNTQPTNHLAGMRRVTAVNIIIPEAKSFSSAVQSINSQSLVQFIKGTENLVVIEFDSSIQKKKKDFRPSLPLVLHW